MTKYLEEKKKERETNNLPPYSPSRTRNSYICI